MPGVWRSLVWILIRSVFWFLNGGKFNRESDKVQVKSIQQKEVLVRKWLMAGQYRVITLWYEGILLLSLTYKMPLCCKNNFSYLTHNLLRDLDIQMNVHKVILWFFYLYLLCFLPFKCILSFRNKGSKSTDSQEQTNQFKTFLLFLTALRLPNRRCVFKKQHTFGKSSVSFFDISLT